MPVNEGTVGKNEDPRIQLGGDGAIKAKDGGWDDNPTMHEDLHMPAAQAPDGLEDAYEALMEAASEEAGLYLKGAWVKVLADWVNGLTNARDRVIERMEERIKQMAALDATVPEGKHIAPPHEDPCVDCWYPSLPPMINAKQVLNLLSLSWPDGNYERAASEPSLPANEANAGTLDDDNSCF